jgi:hypothetical protein
VQIKYLTIGLKRYAVWGVFQRVMRKDTVSIFYTSSRYGPLPPVLESEGQVYERCAGGEHRVFCV